MRVMLLFFFTLSLLFHPLAQASNHPVEMDRIIRLATTTSTENSGLLEYLLPAFEQQSGYKIHVIAVGTGKALRMGRDGDIDVLLVHAPMAEKHFIADGFGVRRIPVMHNDFIIVGPENDPARVLDAGTITEAMQQIAKSKNRFVSRGDDSGTHKKELFLWKKATCEPQGKWYMDAGQGMGKVLLMASEMDAYTLTDRGTWLAYKKQSPLKLLYEGDDLLVNPYSIIAVNPKRHKDTNILGANALIQWITSARTQQQISRFRLYKQRLFIPDAIKLSATIRANTKEDDPVAVFKIKKH